MPELKELLTTQLTQARVNKDKFKLTFYQTFLGELEQTLKGTGKATKKVSTDSLINKQAKAWKKNLTITYNVAYENERALVMETTMKELSLLTPYLPVYSLTGDLLYNVIVSVVVNLDEPKFGAVMKTLVKNHKGLYDAEEAKQMIKDALVNEPVL